MVSLSLWLRLLKTHNLVLARLRPAIASRGITLPQFDVMAQLARAADGLTFGQLSRSLLVSAGNLTGIVDRLEREGLVRRRPVAHDRRSFRVTLTGRGRRRIAFLIRRHERDVETALACVPRSIQQSLRSLLGKASGMLSRDDGARRPAAAAGARPLRKGLTRARRAS